MKRLLSDVQSASIRELPFDVNKLDQESLERLAERCCSLEDFTIYQEFDDAN